MHPGGGRAAVRPASAGAFPRTGVMVIFIVIVIVITRAIALLAIY